MRVPFGPGSLASPSLTAPEAVTGPSARHRRFHHLLTDHRRWIRERSHESYAKNYSVVFPHDEPLAGRNMRTDPLHEVPHPDERPLSGSPGHWGDGEACSGPGEVTRWLGHSQLSPTERARSAHPGIFPNRRRRSWGAGAPAGVCGHPSGTGTDREQHSPRDMRPARGACLGCLSSPASSYSYDETHCQVPSPPEPSLGTLPSP